MSAWWATWNYNQFAYNAYNELDNPWNCITKKSIYVNPNTNINYFSKKCLDPYTAYGFWYRKFADEKQYLNCYNIPYRDPFLAKYGYIDAGNKCGYLGRTNGWNKTEGGFHFYE